MATKKKVVKKAAPKKAAPKKAAPKKAAKKSAREVLVVGSKVKEVIKGSEMRADGQLIQAISDKVHAMLVAGVTRAQQNKRKTVTPHDL